MTGLPPLGPEDEPHPPGPEDEPHPFGPEDEPHPSEPERPARTPLGPQRGGGSVLLGMLIGVLFFGALVGLNILLGPVAPGFLASYLVAPLAYFVTAALLAGRPTTARLGAGLLIAIGVSILLGAGVCAVLATGIGRPS